MGQDSGFDVEAVLASLTTEDKTNLLGGGVRLFLQRAILFIVLTRVLIDASGPMAHVCYT